MHLAMRIEMAVQCRQSAHPVPRCLEFGPGLGQANTARLQVQQACNDLQVVFHPVMDFLHQKLLLGDSSLQPPVLTVQHKGRTPERDVEPAEITC